jgi:hypothetical protein
MARTALFLFWPLFEVRSGRSHADIAPALGSGGKDKARIGLLCWTGPLSGGEDEARSPVAERGFD